MVKGKLKKLKLGRILLCLVILFFVYKNIVSFFTIYSTIIAETGEIVQKAEVDGVILYDEVVISADLAGKIVFNYDTGDRVSVGMAVANVYTGEVDANLQYRLVELEEEIRRLEGRIEKNVYYTYSASEIEMLLLDTTEGFIDCALQGEFESIIGFKNELKDKLDTRTLEEIKRDLNDLNVELDEVKWQVAQFQTELITPKSGIIVNAIDNNENFLEIGSRKKFIPTDIEKLKNNRAIIFSMVDSGQNVCKIVDNYLWYYLGIIDKKTASAMGIGDKVTFWFDKMPNVSVAAEVENINEEKDGEMVVVFKCMSELTGNYAVRATSAVMQFKTYSGIKVPLSCVHVDNNDEVGVYVVRNDILDFVGVEVLYSDDKYAIISDKGTLKLYDEVVMNGINLRDGKKITPN